MKPDACDLLAWPDGELVEIIGNRITCQVGALIRNGTFPTGDAEDGATMYRAFFMRLWLRTYGRTLIKHGTHDHAVYVCAHRGVIAEISREALQMTRSALRWNAPRRSSAGPASE